MVKTISLNFAILSLLCVLEDQLGTGSALMNIFEDKVSEEKATDIVLRASKTAVGFYTMKGYSKVHGGPEKMKDTAEKVNEVPR